MLACVFIYDSMTCFNCRVMNIRHRLWRSETASLSSRLLLCYDRWFANFICRNDDWWKRFKISNKWDFNVKSNQSVRDKVDYSIFHLIILDSSLLKATLVASMTISQVKLWKNEFLVSNLIFSWFCFRSFHLKVELAKLHHLNKNNIFED